MGPITWSKDHKKCINFEGNKLNKGCQIGFLPINIYLISSELYSLIISDLYDVTSRLDSNPITFWPKEGSSPGFGPQF